ncbi:hypothetical protein [Wukongibacter baidiensis]
MASHFSSIGLRINKREDFLDYFRLAYEKGEKIATEKGIYCKWQIGDGIELWGQIDNDNNAIGMNPHFSGSARMKVRITERINRENDTELDGAFYCWADPINNEKDGLYPFIFDSPDMATYGELIAPQIVTAQVTGFAHEISAYKDDDDYNNSQEKETKLAPEAFIPTGLFSSKGKDFNTSSAMALLSGHVIEMKELTNSYTEMKFIWIKLKTLGGEIDAVVDSEILKGNISIGGVVSGMFWLSGKIIEVSK